ncbi:uncharacterized protein [Triticum aestivum]|uniref:uncharacterized protein n=1 Tax=Triticum aestivum TaxID=4565 RepID=UPI001D0219F7|nr:uncharacterized protein LOC123130657 [Triticum aestivum]
MSLANPPARNTRDHPRRSPVRLARAGVSQAASSQDPSPRQVPRRSTCCQVHPLLHTGEELPTATPNPSICSAMASLSFFPRRCLKPPQTALDPAGLRQVTVPSDPVVPGSSSRLRLAAPPPRTDLGAVLACCCSLHPQRPCLLSVLLVRVAPSPPAAAPLDSLFVFGNY